MRIPEKTRVVIIGAGSAGLSALRAVRKETDDYLVVDPGPLGTKCARAGCMPSKTLIRAARDFHRRKALSEQGITGGDGLACDVPAVLRHVRRMRDEFAGHMAVAVRRLAGDRLVPGPVRIQAPRRVDIDGHLVSVGAIVVATGSRPLVPEGWQPFQDHVLTGESLFEQEDLPRRIAVVGMGPIGLEIGQALSRLGIQVTGFDLLESVGGLTDPDVNTKAVDVFEREFALHLGTRAEVQAGAGGSGLAVQAGNACVEVDAVLAAMGTRPNVDDLGLENLGVELDGNGLPPVHPRTMQVGDLPVFMAGDCNGSTPVLHEAVDEGHIAGTNAAGSQVREFCRRVLLRVVFSDPEIAMVGTGCSDQADDDPWISGVASYDDQGRALIDRRASGLLHIRAHAGNGRILGAEMVAPEAASLAHILALAVERQTTVAQMLQMPFYHPTLEEGMETALHDAAANLGVAYRPEALMLCDSRTEEPLA